MLIYNRYYKIFLRVYWKDKDLLRENEQQRNVSNTLNGYLYIKSKQFHSLTIVDTSSRYRTYFDIWHAKADNEALPQIHSFANLYRY